MFKIFLVNIKIGGGGLRFFMRRKTNQNPPCPHCGYRLIKNGKKKLKYKTVQQYYCKRCKKSISDNKPKHFTFPLVANKLRGAFEN